MPANLRYIEGSTKIKNARYPNGNSIHEDYLIMDGLKIGNYNPGANAYIMFTVEVIDDNLSEGLNTIENIVSGGMENTTIEDSVKINIQNNKNFNTRIIVQIVAAIICLITIIVCKIVKRIKNHKF